VSEYALAADRAGLHDVGCGPGAVAVHLGRLSGHGFKPPVRSAGEAMVAAGYMTPREFERWQEAFRRIDADDAPVTYFLPIFCAIGRRLTGPTTSR